MNVLFHLFNRFAHCAGPGKEPPRVQAVWCEVDGLMHRSSGDVCSAFRASNAAREEGTEEDAKRAERRERRGPHVRVLNNINSTDRVCWGRARWLDAKFEVRSGRSDLRNEQQRQKREERREKQEESDQHDEDESLEMAMVRPQKGGMVQKRVGPSGRGGQSAERRAQREASRERDKEKERERDTSKRERRAEREERRGNR